MLSDVSIPSFVCRLDWTFYIRKVGNYWTIWPLSYSLYTVVREVVYQQFLENWVHDRFTKNPFRNTGWTQVWSISKKKCSAFKNIVNLLTKMFQRMSKKLTFCQVSLVDMTELIAMNTVLCIWHLAIIRHLSIKFLMTNNLMAMSGQGLSARWQNEYT